MFDYCIPIIKHNNRIVCVVRWNQRDRFFDFYASGKFLDVLPR